MTSKNKKVVVAMSGGVDSSVAAGMLKEEGYEVIGITLQLYNSKQEIKSKTCCSGIDIYDAKEVARKLDIAHYVLNYQENFKKTVINNFIASYKNGETPIPCVQCNQHIKFEDLLLTAKGLGAEFLATGHYIRKKKINNFNGLFKAKDESKDQSYFLFQVKEKDLSFLKFPLGDLLKEETRSLAKKFAIPVADKPESQDICFIPDGNYRKFLSKYKGFKKTGNILDTKNNLLGKHDGIENYTIGQRKHINVSINKPLYVIKIIKETNNIIVGEKEDLKSSVIHIDQLNWLGDKIYIKNKYCDNLNIKVRARQKTIKGKLEFLGNNHGKVLLDEHTYAVSKGQGCVFYNNEDQLLGGGWIK